MDTNIHELSHPNETSFRPIERNHLAVDSGVHNSRRFEPVNWNWNAIVSIRAHELDIAVKCFDRVQFFYCFRYFHVLLVPPH